MHQGPSTEAELTKLVAGVGIPTSRVRRRWVRGYSVWLGARGARAHGRERGVGEAFGFWFKQSDGRPSLLSQYSDSRLIGVFLS